MEKSSKRGKIPQTDWPQIMARYEAGETLASIARTYDCSAPAISYIVSRSREKPSNITAPALTAEPQLIKAPANDAPPRLAEPPVASPPVAPPPVQLRREPAMASGGMTNGTREGEAANLFLRNGAAPRSAPPPSTSATAPAYPSPTAAHTGDTRQRLHLSLGGNGGSTPGNGTGHVGSPGTELEFAL